MPGYDSADDEMHGDEDDWTGRDARDLDDCPDDLDDGDQWTCVLGERCLVADPFHRADECFDLEWAEAYFAEADTLVADERASAEDHDDRAELN